MDPSSQSLKQYFQPAKWIWPDGYSWDLHNGYALFRRDFTLHAVPAAAVIRLTADQSYQLYVNGQYVCRGPARGFQSHWPFDEVEVTPFLRTGRNVLALRAHNPGFSNFQYVTQGFAGVLLSAQWDGLEIYSDASWKSRRQTGIHRDTVPTSLQLFCQEHIDLRAEDPNWMDLDYDDSSWTAPMALHEWNGMPWPNLEARSIPLLEEGLVAPPRVIGFAEGTSAPDYECLRDVSRHRAAEGLSHRPAPAESELRISATGPGRFTSFLLDFGHTVVGSAGFRIQGANGGEILDTLYTETLDESTLAPHYTPDGGSRTAFGQRLICRPGDQEHAFYHAFGFRYLVVTLRDTTGELRVTPFLRSAIYPLERKAVFRTSDEVLQRIWETSAWTQRVCSLDSYVDTPWREQVQWWGDARVQAKNTFFYSGDTRLFARGIAQIAAQTAPMGLTYGHAPTMAHTCIIPDFTLIWLLTLADFAWQTDSLDPFLQHQTVIRDALAYFEEMTDPARGLVAYDPRFWLFLDWTGLHKDGYSTVYNLWLLLALDGLAELYRHAGLSEDQERLTHWANRLRQSLGGLIAPDGLVMDGLTSAGEFVNHASIHSQTLAIMAGLHPEHNAARLQKVLLPFIRGETAPEITPSAYWITYVFEVLTRAGHGLEVAEYIRRRWRPMIEHGTTWEVFDPQHGLESFSHAWSAHPLYHLMETLGGIRQHAPGWREIVFEPCFHGECAEVTVPTPQGPISARWSRAGASLDIQLVLPPGVIAHVKLPGTDPSTYSGSNHWTISALPLHETIPVATGFATKASLSV